MIPDTFGLHLIILPELAHRIPVHCQESLTNAARVTCRLFACTCVAVHAREDHLHVLISATSERDITAMVHALLQSLQDAITACGGPFRSFAWDAAVHVTLLPPWHIEILASFVRDQDRYHEQRTLEQELNEVFQPNAISQDDIAHVN